MSACRRRTAATLVTLATLLPALASAQNLALGRPTFSSGSTRHLHRAQRGRRQHRPATTTTAPRSTGAVAPRLVYVDLGQTTAVSRIEFWNRTDSGVEARIIGCDLGIFAGVPYGGGGASAGRVVGVHRRHRAPDVHPARPRERPLRRHPASRGRQLAPIAELGGCTAGGRARGARAVHVRLRRQRLVAIAGVAAPPSPARLSDLRLGGRPSGRRRPRDRAARAPLEVRRGAPGRVRPARYIPGWSAHPRPLS